MIPRPECNAMELPHSLVHFVRFACGHYMAIFGEISLQSSSVMEFNFFKSSCYGKKPVGIVLCIVAENTVTDRHTYRMSTVTLTVHVC